VAVVAVLLVVLAVLAVLGLVVMVVTQRLIAALMEILIPVRAEVPLVVVAAADRQEMAALGLSF
jgi:hypothetical protein